MPGGTRGLERKLHPGTRMTLVGRPEGAGRHARVPPEHPREMTLIAEAPTDADLRDRRAPVGELSGRALDPEPADVVADRSVTMRAERSREVGGMNSDLPRDAGERERLVEIFVDQVAHPRQPRGRGTGALRGRTPRRLDQQLQDQALHRERREPVAFAEFPVDPLAQPLETGRPEQAGPGGDI